MKNHNRNALRGTGTVFRYTMQQHYKTTSVRVFLIILFLLALASFPVIGMLTGKNTEPEAEFSDMKRLYLLNATGFSVSEEDIRADERYASLEISPLSLPDIADPTHPEEMLTELLEKEPDAAAAIIAADEQAAAFTVKGYYGENGNITFSDIQTLANLLENALHQAILRDLNITEAQEETLGSKVLAAQVTTLTDYRSGSDAAGVDTDTHLFVNLFYAYLILILSALAMGYIFQFCMEEKTSKLVESLLVSVEPTALLAGKILAASCMLFLGLGLIAFGLFCSYRIAGGAVSFGLITEFSRNSFDADLSGLHIGVSTLLLLIPCLLLAYAICAFFSGIVGSCCAKLEDTQQASLAVVLFLMIGYMAGSLLPAMESDAVNYFCSLFPLTSIFTALPNYVCGKIGLPIFLLALAIQAVTAYLLARLAGSVYRMMLLYRGGFPKPAQLLRMLKENRAAEKAAAGKEDSHEA